SEPVLPHVVQTGLGEPVRHRLPAELRVAPRARERAHIDDPGHPRAAHQVEEVLGRQGAVAEGEDAVRGHAARVGRTPPGRPPRPARTLALAAGERSHAAEQNVREPGPWLTRPEQIRTMDSTFWIVSNWELSEGIDD